MGLGRKIAAVGFIAIALVVVEVGCGGGGSSSSADSTTQSTGTTVPEDASSGIGNPPASENSSLEPSREFLGSGRNGTLAKIGKESSATEREAASRVLEEFFEAGEAGDWKTQCSLLATSVRQSLESASLGSADCATALEAQASRAPASVRANTMTGPIDAFRINQGVNGFAFYHGTGARDYVIPMIDQDGWKLVALQAEPIE